ncbi:UV DNA damage endonuclease, partial [Tremellales sp. Uapishka_1]
MVFGASLKALSFSRSSLIARFYTPTRLVAHRAFSPATFPSARSSISISMPPRRGRAVKGAPPAADLSTAAVSPESNITLVQALDDLPKSGIVMDSPLTAAESSASPLEAPSTKEVVDAAVVQAIATGKRKRVAQKAAASYAEDEHDDSSELSEPDDIAAPPKRTPKKKAKEEQEDGYSALSSDGGSEAEPSLDEASEVEEKPKKAKARTPKKKVVAVDGEEKEKTPRKPTPKKSRIAKDEPEFDEDGNEIVKKKRKAKVYVPKVYEIPEVEKKTTTFKGRLGYACLNTVLRSTKPESVFCSRTCRIASIEEEGMELVKGLAMLNVKDLKTMIEWNEQNKIRFMRLSSDMFPFASHQKYGYDLSFAAAELKEAGDLAKQYGHRLTMHPGQFTQLGSPKDAVVEASVRELTYQCEVMDRMGLDKDGVMIIHMGGVYGDKPTTLARFKENYTTKLSDNIKQRLVLENDEICYNVDDILPVCNELEIPIIFDYHHDWIYPSEQPPSVLIPLIAETWKKKGIKMKQHLSEPRPGAESVMERRAHADRCQNLPPDLPDDVDLMIEAKDKEQAVFELYRMYGLEDVIHENLRPPNPNPSMHTNGRKSSLKKKVKETGMTDDEGNPVELEDIDKDGDGGVGNATEDPGMEIDVDGKPPVKAKKERKAATPKKGKKNVEEAKVEVEEVKVEEGVSREGEAEAAGVVVEEKKKRKGRAPKKVKAEVAV